MANANILASGNLCSKVFKLQLKVINNNLYTVLARMFPLAVMYRGDTFLKRGDRKKGIIYKVREKTPLGN